MKHSEMYLGLDKHHNTIKHIDEVHGGLNCACVCVVCGEELVAKKGPIMRHHFAHSVRADYSLQHGFGESMTYIHKAVQHFLRSKLVETHSQRYEGSGYLSDACGVTSKGKKVIFEVEVSQRVSDDKLNFIKTEYLGDYHVYFIDITREHHQDAFLVCKDVESFVLERAVAIQTHKQHLDKIKKDKEEKEQRDFDSLSGRVSVAEVYSHLLPLKELSKVGAIARNIMEKLDLPLVKNFDKTGYKVNYFPKDVVEKAFSLYQEKQDY